MANQQKWSPVILEGKSASVSSIAFQAGPLFTIIIYLQYTEMPLFLLKKEFLFFFSQNQKISFFFKIFNNF